MKNKVRTRPDVWDEVSALRHVVSAMWCVVRDLAKDKGTRYLDSVAHMEQVMKEWHEQRSTRWEQEVEHAKSVLAKDADISGP